VAHRRSGARAHVPEEPVQGQRTLARARRAERRRFITRHGGWRSYEEGTLFFYIDEYVKDAPKDLLTVLGATSEWLERSLKKESTLVQKNIDALAGLCS
jgi:hypothetical protein